MKYYSNSRRDVIDLTTDQWNFIIAMVENYGDITKVRAKHPMSDMLLAQFQQDYEFWLEVQESVALVIRARRLDPDFLKDHMVAAISGKGNLTNQQMQAINSAVRLLAPRPGNQTLIATKDSDVQITFNEGQPPTPAIDVEVVTSASLPPAKEII